MNILSHVKPEDLQKLADLSFDQTRRVLLEAISSMREAVTERAIKEAENGNDSKAIKLLHQAKALSWITSVKELLTANKE